MFHLATAALFQIGLFPWVMIALTPIFFAPDWPRTLLARASGRTVGGPSTRAPTVRRPSAFACAALLALAAVNLVLPLRHYAADGNVRFNDDGYYLSWRVMLTERSGFVEFDVVDPATGQTWHVGPRDVLADWQAAQVTRRPDLILTTAHLIATEWGDRGHPDVEVFANAWVSFNGRPRQRWVAADVDLAALRRSAPAVAYVLPDRPAVVE